MTENVTQSHNFFIRKSPKLPSDTFSIFFFYRRVWVRGALRSSKTRRDSIRGPLRVRQEHWMFPNKGPKDLRGPPKRVLKHFCKIKLICSFLCRLQACNVILQFCVQINVILQFGMQNKVNLRFGLKS